MDRDNTPEGPKPASGQGVSFEGASSLARAIAILEQELKRNRENLQQLQQPIVARPAEQMPTFLTEKYAHTDGPRSAALKTVYAALDAMQTRRIELKIGAMFVATASLFTLATQATRETAPPSSSAIEPRMLAMRYQDLRASATSPTETPAKRAQDVDTDQVATPFLSVTEDDSRALSDLMQAITDAARPSSARAATRDQNATDLPKVMRPSTPGYALTLSNGMGQNLPLRMALADPPANAAHTTNQAFQSSAAPVAPASTPDPHATHEVATTPKATPPREDASATSREKFASTSFSPSSAVYFPTVPSFMQSAVYQPPDGPNSPRAATILNPSFEPVAITDPAPAAINPARDDANHSHLGQPSTPQATRDIAALESAAATPSTTPQAPNKLAPEAPRAAPPRAQAPLIQSAATTTDQVLNPVDRPTLEPTPRKTTPQASRPAPTPRTKAAAVTTPTTQSAASPAGKTRRVASTPVKRRTQVYEPDSILNAFDRMFSGQ